MNDLHDLLAVLDDRADHANGVRPDLGAVRTRARRKRRTHQALSATAAVTAVGLGAGAPGLSGQASTRSGTRSPSRSASGQPRRSGSGSSPAASLGH